MRLILLIAAFVLNLWALLDLAGTSQRRRSMVGWATLIVAVPILGATTWLVRSARGRRVPNSVMGKRR